MAIGNIQVGVDPIRIADRRIGYYADILVQNNSANLVYVLYGKSQGVADGIILAANTGVYRCSANDRELWVVAAAAASDVRYDIEYYPKNLPGR